MSDWLAAVLLGLIEGVTQFLPVSSAGHLLLVENLGWVPAQSELFNIVIQSATVFAVIGVFSARVREIFEPVSVTDHHRHHQPRSMLRRL